MNRGYLELVVVSFVAALVFAVPATADAKKICYGTKKKKVGTYLKWIGTAPACKGSKRDCTKRKGTYVKSSKKGNGSKCWSGKKVLCKLPRYKTYKKCINVERGYKYKWRGTAPLCGASSLDCTDKYMEYMVSSKKGNGAKCVSGRKVLCRRRVRAKAPNYPNWMRDNLKRIGKRTLKQMVLPATHDSATYAFTGLSKFAAPYARTQFETIGSQLRGGIRYFDLRPVYHRGRIYIHHGPIIGPRFANVLRDVDSFLRRRRELVVLNISHFDKMSGRVLDRFAAEVKRYVGRYVYHSETNFMNVPLNTLLARGSRVIIVSDKKLKGLGVYKSPGKYIHDKYSNTDSFAKMYKDQVKQLNKPANHKAKLFFLSWTMTQQNPFGDIKSIKDADKLARVNLRKAASNIHQLSWRANPKLGAFVANTLCKRGSRMLKPNILYVDFFRESFVVTYALRLNSLNGKCYGKPVGSVR